MFIINITYKVSLDKIDEYLQSHMAYLEKQYELKNFIASGRKEPRIVGVILSKIDSKDKLKKIIKEDPFYEKDILSIKICESSN